MTQDPPVSCVGQWDMLVALIPAAGTFLACRSEGLSTTTLALLLIAAVATPLALAEIFRAPWIKRKPAALHLRELIPKASIALLGYLSAVALAISIYWIFPEYQLDFYRPFFDALAMVLPYGPSVVAFYFLATAWLVPIKNSGPWHAGMLMLGQWHSVDWQILHQYGLSILVIAFFLPISFSELVANLDILRLPLDSIGTHDLYYWYRIAFITIILFELVFVTSGYSMVARLLNSHVHTVDRTLLGWLSALICYDPFFLLIFTRYLDYHGDFTWIIWLTHHETLAVLWGTAILVLMLIHFWADSCFGLHFSNLTNRGIITNGPYRFCKHPAYLCKNIRWWLTAVPFAAGPTVMESVRLSLLLFGVNLIYAVRAYTEERHLSKDPVYIAYAEWIDHHGLFHWIPQLIPKLSFAYRLRRWTSA
jgi:isoprenylcysteine carboxyl methyltransferase (ICMT) family protein YpbQ